MSNIIFLDFDGPMIPARAAYLPKQTGIPSVFDPCAVALVNKLAADAEAKIVVHSRWRVYQNYQELFPCLKTHMINQGIHEHHINETFVCPGTPTTNRWEDITSYLHQHNDKIDKFVIIEDMPLHKDFLNLESYYVKVDYDEGFTFKKFNEARTVLGLDPVTFVLM